MPLRSLFLFLFLFRFCQRIVVSYLPKDDWEDYVNPRYEVPVRLAKQETKRQSLQDTLVYKKKQTEATN